MGKKYFSILLLTVSLFAFGQTRPGSFRGKVTEQANGETIPFANITIKDDAGEIVAGGSTDFDGVFNINPVPAGKYTVECSFTGMATVTLKGVNISPNTPTNQDFKLREASEMLTTVEITYEAPLIEKGKTGTVTTSEDIVNMAVRDITSVAAQTAGVVVSNNGETNIRGSRGEGTVYFIDGVKVRGSVNIPQAAILQTEVISGGLPAQYGDAVGGVISTTTRGPSGKFFGNAEVLTSAPFTLLFDGLDEQNYNLAALTVGGPIYKKGDKTIVGFLMSSEYQYVVEPRPGAQPYLSVNEDTLKSYQENPLRLDPSGNSVNSRSLYLNDESISEIDRRPNSWDNQLRLNGTIQVLTSSTTNFNVGGRFVYDNDKASSYASHLLNYNNNVDRLNRDWSVFARFQQRFENSEDKDALIKNAYYNIQVDYTRDFNETRNDRFGDNAFLYGHVGYFDLQQNPAYVYDDTLAGGAYRFVGTQTTGVNFTGSGYNPIRENYVEQYFNLAKDNPGLRTEDILLISGAGVPINGTNPGSVYGLWTDVGTSQGGFSQSRNSQFRLTASTNFDIKNHSIIVGFEFEQRIDRAYSLSPLGMWAQMRQLQNRAQTELDVDNPIYVVNEQGVFQDTVNYNFLYNQSDRSEFGANVRNLLGVANNQQINIDNIDPNLFSLDMFAPDELINIGGTRYVSYYGYDHTGQILNTNPSVEDFYTAVDENGNFKREVGAFQPIYIAGYIQDQFNYKDLTFNVGIRVDRFDLNQSVLKDPYSLFPTYAVKDLASSPLSDAVVPSSIGQDFVVYVNNTEYTSGSGTSTQIVGYRDGSQWYNAIGEPIADPKEIADAAGGRAQPFLVDPARADTANTLDPATFRDYEPEVVVMPRISFNFPITDEAIFVAHFDKLAQRPTTGLSRLDPFQYLDLLNQRSSAFYNNPDLRPQITTEYEIGFKQALTDRSAIKIAAFYRELRDLIQVTYLSQAYPISYTAYGNQDFGTVKAFTLEYDLRRVNNIRINANYTLQFADGTGSGPNSGANLANSGQPNLRYLLPLTFDNRHQLLFRFDYRYADGPNYNGPVWGDKNVLANAGINITMNALSGAPYTKRSQAYSIGGDPSSVPIDGQVNGTRLPWQFTVDMRINKIFAVGKDKKNSLEVYLQILNALNTQNVINVYNFTGSADDDGYLTSAQAQANIQEQVNTQSYVDLYARRVASPFNYSLPRRFRIGISYNF